MIEYKLCGEIVLSNAIVIADASFPVSLCYRTIINISNVPYKYNYYEKRDSKNNKLLGIILTTRNDFVHFKTLKETYMPLESGYMIITDINTYKDSDKWKTEYENILSENLTISNDKNCIITKCENTISNTYYVHSINDKIDYIEVVL